MLLGQNYYLVTLLQYEKDRIENIDFFANSHFLDLPIFMHYLLIGNNKLQQDWKDFQS